MRTVASFTIIIITSPQHSHHITSLHLTSHKEQHHTISHISSHLITAHLSRHKESKQNVRCRVNAFNLVACRSTKQCLLLLVVVLSSIRIFFLSFPFFYSTICICLTSSTGAPSAWSLPTAILVLVVLACAAAAVPSRACCCCCCPNSLEWVK